MKNLDTFSGSSRVKRGINLDIPDKASIKWFRTRLRNWSISNFRDFPWRSCPEPYLVCISEIFLQQTSANKVAEILGPFIERYPNWESLATSTSGDIEEAIRPLGLYRRRSNTILNLANEVVSLGGLPNTRTGLEKLPGIGQYIANVLLVVFEHKRLSFLDVNMARVLERFFGPRLKADIRDDPYLQVLSRKVVNVQDALSANWMILDFAAVVCTKRRPKCLDCPISEHCRETQKTITKLSL